MFKRVVMAALLVAMAAPASASTPESWAQLEQRVLLACGVVSGLTRVRPVGDRVSFSDEVGVELRMIRGKDRRGREQRMLCAYKRGDGPAEVRPVPNWAGSTRR